MFWRLMDRAALWWESKNCFNHLFLPKVKRRRRKRQVFHMRFNSEQNRRNYMNSVIFSYSVGATHSYWLMWPWECEFEEVVQPSRGEELMGQCELPRPFSNKDQSFLSSILQVNISLLFFYWREKKGCYFPLAARKTFKDIFCPIIESRPIRLFFAKVVPLDAIQLLMAGCRTSFITI